MGHYRKVHLGTPTYVSFVNYFKFLEPPPPPPTREPESVIGTQLE